MAEPAQDLGGEEEHRIARLERHLGRLGGHVAQPSESGEKPGSWAFARPRYGAPTRRHHEKGTTAISSSPTRGTLRPATDSPATGERIEQFFTLGNVVFEQILSGADVEPQDYLQDQDEWVVVLAGRAVMEVGGGRAELGPGEWLLLPAGVPHRLVEVDAGTNWLAVHVH